MKTEDQLLMRVMLDPEMAFSKPAVKHMWNREHASPRYHL